MRLLKFNSLHAKQIHSPGRATPRGAPLLPTGRVPVPTEVGIYVYWFTWSVVGSADGGRGTSLGAVMGAPPGREVVFAAGDPCGLMNGEA